jgi:hypothetical protein
MRITTQQGEAILSVDDWFLKAPPKKGALQWQDYRSAKELARSWFRSPLASPPQELLRWMQDSFPSEAATLTEAHPEYVIRLDDYPGEHRNADLVILGTLGPKKLFISMEAKADEPFGDLIGEYFDSRIAVPRSKAPARIAALVRAIFNSELDAGIRPLRYQLLHAVAATLIEAQQRGAEVAAFLVHEFLSTRLQPDKVLRNHLDWQSFVARLARDQAAPVQAGRTIGPIFVAGGGLVPSTIPLYLGKIQSNLE